MLAVRLLITVIAVLFAFSLTVNSGRLGHRDKDEDHRLFAQFMKDYRRIYRENELSMRFEIFATNLQFIEDYNREQHSAVLGIGPHADMTNEEFKKKRLGLKGPFAPESECHTSLYENLNAAAQLNWAAQGAVTPVKDQLQCGACWAFSAVAAMESAWYLAKKQLISLSEQQLIDCSTTTGCDGGWFQSAFQYVIDNNGICTEVDYTFSGKSDPYCMAGMCQSVASLSAWTCVQPKNDTALVQAANYGPVSVSISGSTPAFQHYKSGILQNSDCNGNLDHAVAVVGYGQDPDGQRYFIIKNSWGMWGMQGYAYVAFGSDACGLTAGPALPIV